MSNEQLARSNHKELLEVLNRKNGLRAFISAIIFTLVIPVYLIIVHITNMYGVHTSNLKTLMVFMEIFEIASLIFGFLLISQDETEKINIFYRIYFPVNILFGLLVARAELAYANSILAFVIFAIYSIAVPIPAKNERRYFSAGVALLMVILGASAGGVSRDTVEIAFVAAFTIFASGYMNENIVSHEHLEVKLKAKTRTSERDPLTGLTNRRGLDRKASVMWSYCVKNRLNPGLIEIDIDYFKKYNDRFGHPAGDRCLKKVADAIRQAASHHTDIVARTGGEEFMVFVQGMSKKDIIELCLNIRKKISELGIENINTGVSSSMTVSMGVAIATTDDVDNFDELYEEADKALYTAKTNGRNCIVCDNKIYGRMRNRLAAVSTL